MRTVNAGLRATPRDHDVLLLNTDIRVHGHTIPVLQETAYRYSAVGSVTPLTNRGSIASLAHWPHGQVDISSLPARIVTEIVEATRIRTPNVAAPTGVGFCMYIPRHALKTTGLLDEKHFGRGYGEENDWSQRAAALGLAHLICTETFVFHHEGSSFALGNRTRHLRSKVAAVATRHPLYPMDVAAYIQLDPLQRHREILLQRISIQAGLAPDT